MREGVNPSPLELYFDTVDFRLHPVHPYLHLLPRSRTSTDRRSRPTLRMEGAELTEVEGAAWNREQAGSG
jgi:hypothetical protein